MFPQLNTFVTCMFLQFTLRVRVSDGINGPAFTDVVVAVVNVNDLQPVFQSSNYTFVVTENTDCSLPLGQVGCLIFLLVLLYIFTTML